MNKITVDMLKIGKFNDKGIQYLNEHIESIPLKIDEFWSVEFQIDNSFDYFHIKINDCYHYVAVFLGDALEETLTNFFFPHPYSITIDQFKVFYDDDGIVFEPKDAYFLDEIASFLRSPNLCNTYIGNITNITYKFNSKKFYLSFSDSLFSEPVLGKNVNIFLFDLFSNFIPGECENVKEEVKDDFEPIRVRFDSNYNIILTLSIEDLFKEEDFTSETPMRKYRCGDGTIIYYGYKGQKSFLPVICNKEIWFGTGERSITCVLDSSTDLKRIISAWIEFRDYLRGEKEYAALV